MSYDGRVYTVQIGKLQRELPIFEVAPGIKIAIFNMLGDTEVVEVAATELAVQLPANAQVLVVPEVKAIPLGHALSARSGLPYIVARKIRKPYMVNCIAAEVVSITTGKPQTLYIDGKDRALIQGRNAVIVDDVISTGSTLQAMRALLANAEAKLVGEMAVFTEGDRDEWRNVLALGHLPVFTN